MSYIGRQPQIGNFQICDAISTVNNQAAYTMQVGSVNVIPETAQNMIVSLNGVIQKGGGTNPSYTVAGAVITFSSALVTGDVINFIQILGSVLDLGTPSDDTVTAVKLSSNAVTTAKINNDAVTVDKLNLISTGSVPSLEAKGTSGVTEGYIQLNCAENTHGIKIKSPPHSASASYTLTMPNNDGDANQFLQTNGSGVLSFASATPADNSITLAKMASGTDGNIISYDTSGNPVAVATGNDGQVLTSAGAGAIPTFETLPVGGITQTDAWRITADTSTEGDITANWERSDAPSFGKIGSGLSQSSGIFTFPATGLYLVEYRAGFKCSSGSEYATTILYATINNSSYANVDATHLRIYDNEFENTARTQGFINCTNTSNVKVKFNWSGSGSNLVLQGDSDSQVTGASFIRLGDSV